MSESLDDKAGKHLAAQELYLRGIAEELTEFIRGHAYNKSGKNEDGRHHDSGEHAIEVDPTFLGFPADLVLFESDRSEEEDGSDGDRLDAMHFTYNEHPSVSISFQTLGGVGYEQGDYSIHVGEAAVDFEPDEPPEFAQRVVGKLVVLQRIGKMTSLEG